MIEATALLLLSGATALGGGGGTAVVLTGGPLGGSGIHVAAFASGRGTGTAIESHDNGCFGTFWAFGLAFAPARSVSLALAAAVALTCLG